MYDEELAFTGLGTVSLFGLAFDVLWLTVATVVLILVGVAMSRLASRRK